MTCHHKLNLIGNNKQERTIVQLYNDKTTLFTVDVNKKFHEMTVWRKVEGVSPYGDGIDFR